MLTGLANAEAVGAAVNRARLYRYISKPWDEKNLVFTLKEGISNYFLRLRIDSQNKELGKLYDQAKLEIIEKTKIEQELRQALKENEDLRAQLKEENQYLRREIQVEHNFSEIIGNSDSLKYILYRLEQVAPNDTTVLIQGETGTGKELIARAIHQASLRTERPLIKVNCATLPADLIESELFGHEKGAFTGAHSKKTGRFEIAHKGTLFLDEIGELPLNLQAKLLRVIEYGEFERLGARRALRRSMCE